MLKYLTIDPTNATTAQRLAERFGIPLEIVEPRDWPQLEREQAQVVLDYDFMPADYRNQLLNGSKMTVVATHGFLIPDSVASFLPHRGVIVAKRLDDRLFRAIIGLGYVA